MAIPVSQFWASLLDNRLADKPQCAQWAKQFAQEHGVDRPRETEPLAAWLVKTGRLTDYQAGVLVRGESHERPLWFEPWRVTGPARRVPFSRWVRAESTASKAAVLGWILPQMPEPDSALDRLCGTPLPGVYPLRLVSSRHDAAILLAPEPSGRLLEDQLKDGPLDPLATMWMAAKIAAALARVHAQGGVLSALRPDRAWIEDDDEITLIPDIAVAGQPLLDDATPDAAAYNAAPELTLPSKKADAATDIHSAGCLLFRALFGHAPRLAEGWPTELTAPSDEATKLAAQVISHAMARDPRARFASAEQMRAAATRAAQLVSTAQPQTKAAAPAAAPPQPKAGETSRPGVTAAPATASPAPAKPAAPQRSSSLPTTPPAASEPAPKSPPRREPPEKTPAASPRPKTPATANQEPPQALAKGAATADHKETKPKRATPSPKQATAAAVAMPPGEAPDGASPSAAVAKERRAEAEASAAGETPPKATQQTPPVAASAADSPTVPTGAPGPASRPARGPSATARGRRKKKKNLAPLAIAGASVLCIIGLVLALRPDPSAEVASSRPPYTPPPPSTPAVQPDPAPTPTADGGEPSVQLVDSESVLWASPSTAPAPPLDLVPAGASAILRIRPGALRAADESAELLVAFQPELDGALEAVAARTGVPLEAMDSLVVSLHENSGGVPELGLVVQLKEPRPLDELVAAWGEPAPARTAGGQTLLVGDETDGDAFYPASGMSDAEGDSAEVARFAVGPPQLMERVAEFEGAAAPLPPSIESLWRETSADADLLLVGQPNFFFAGGRQLLDQFAPNLRGSLKAFLVPDVAAFSLQMSFTPRWYTELRLAPGGAVTPAALAEKLDREIDALPQYAEQFLLNANPDSSWRALAIRLPAMMRAVKQRTRVGVSEEQTIANLYLPAPAAPNVLLATLLAANTPASVATDTTTPTAAQPLTLAEMLDRPTSVAFDQESLQSAAGTIAELFNADLPPGSEPLEIELIGGDLEKAGITQNQQIRDFEHRDQPLRTVLTRLVMQANPVTTVTSPTEDDQKLVWVASPEDHKILITTRTAAQANYELPKEFVAVE